MNWENVTKFEQTFIAPQNFFGWYAHDYSSFPSLKGCFSNYYTSPFDHSQQMILEKFIKQTKVHRRHFDPINQSGIEFKDSLFNFFFHLIKA